MTKHEDINFNNRHPKTFKDKVLDKIKKMDLSGNIKKAKSDFSGNSNELENPITGSVYTKDPIHGKVKITEFYYADESKDDYREPTIEDIFPTAVKWNNGQFKPSELIDIIKYCLKTYSHNRSVLKNIKTLLEGKDAAKPEAMSMNSTNPKDIIGSKKVDLSLIPPVANILEAKVMELGANKYSAYNWRTKKVQSMVYLSAILRHLYALLDGQDNDEETGISHMASIRANTGIYLDALEGGNLVDTRPVKGTSAEVLKRYTQK